MKIVETEVRGHTIKFAIESEIDVIQRHHIKGLFYARDELEMISEHIPENAEILDCGTNVGNHAIWFAKILGARKVWIFEPNPVAIAILKQNIELNGIADQLVMDNLGYGLSDKAESDMLIRMGPKNLGAARITGKGGDIEVRPGDDLIGDASPDFVKIDVERMEMQVLAGLDRCLRRCRPPLFIEIDIANEDAFEAWRAEHRYRVVDRRQQVKRNATYMCLPEG
ncbi:MAG: FkbM family methyltransferase [Pseudomonadota bacterium]